MNSVAFDCSALRDDMPYNYLKYVMDKYLIQMITKSDTSGLDQVKRKKII